ncbi:bacteriocin-like protein [Mucilaginibacter sp.]|jgi:hypothetical protein|uniref:bacteriocin-like protein n=1 Tax=Mucilaginibacter sp. TaxID=1882438 RepID=UPI002D7EBCEA|nr:hypothetical protein [Mucilaginibacter sp.]
MKKFQKLSRNEMKRVKGGSDTPTCPTNTFCITMNGYAGTCSQATQDLQHCPCIGNGQTWDHVSMCPVGGS